MKTLYIVGDIVKRWKIVFYIGGEDVEGGDLIIEAMDYDWAVQVRDLMLNTKTNIPSVWDSYSNPILIG